MNERLLNEARRIADQLLKDAKKDEAGIYWETMTMDLDQNITFKISEGVYSGVAGIALFFLELYNQTKYLKYLQASIEGMRWVEDYCRKNPPTHFGFITGRIGVSYAMLRMHESLESEGEKQGEWLEKALALARSCFDLFKSPGGVDDLIGGGSGTILNLLHLHAASGEKWLLEGIDMLVEKLLRRAHHGPKGLYWDRSDNSMSGLCGYSHGAAGIGFVFLELGHYFQNSAFYKIAEQAFLYERHYYSESKKNWPDLRKGMYSNEDTERFIKAYFEKNLAEFTTYSDMNAWCHGAAGIGLSRLRAHQLLEKELYEEEARIAIEKTIKSDVESEYPNQVYIICHGGGGNADLFLYAYRLTNDKQYLSLAEKVAHKAVDSYERNKYYASGYRMDPTKREDRSLFMGNAGIGLFYLRVLDPFHVPSVLVTPVESVIKPGESLSSYPHITLSLKEIKKLLLQKNFKRTLFVADELIPQELNTFLENEDFTIDNPIPLIQSFIAFMEKVIPALSVKQKEQFAEIFQLESDKRRMDEGVLGHSYLAVKEKALGRQGKEVLERAADEKALNELTLRLDPDLRLEILKWNWSLGSPEEWKKNLEKEYDEGQDEWLLLLKPGVLEVAEIELSPFTYTIMVEFQESNRVDRVMQATVEAFEALEPEEEAMLREKIIHQIRHLIEVGGLCPPE